MRLFAVASLLIGGMVGACSAMLHKHISITGDWDEGWVTSEPIVAPRGPRQLAN